MSSNDGNMTILDSLSGESLDCFQIALLDRVANTHLPELYSVLGKNKLMKFLDVFGGITITVPQREVVTTALRDVCIFAELVKACSSARPRVVKELALKYSLTDGVVRRIYSEMEGRMERYHFQFSRGNYGTESAASSTDGGLPPNVEGVGDVCRDSSSDESRQQGSSR